MGWRNIIIGFANFWREGFSAVVYPNREVENLSERLGFERRQCDFGIVVDDRNIAISPTRLSERIMAPLPFLRGIVSHSKAIHLESLDVCLNPAFLRKIHVTAQVESLSIMNSCNVDHCHDNNPHHFSLPNVEFLRCRNVNCVVTSTSLTELTFSHISVDNALTILRNCPNLITVYLWDVHGISGPMVPQPPLLLRFVDDFSLSIHQNGLNLLKPLRMPELQMFRLKLCDEAVNVEDIQQLVGSPLWRGTMKHIGLDLVDVLRLQRTFPNLKLQQYSESAWMHQ
jgi:hypothetical protein